MNLSQIKGNWDEGVALDQYTESSKFIGEDVFGHPVFENNYSEIGKLIYQFKYNGHLDTREEIANMVSPVLANWISDKHIDIILPCPASMIRTIQPVYAIAEAVAEQVGIPYNDQVLKKQDSSPVKNQPKESRKVEGSILQTKPAKKRCNILLIDDIYETGATANECVRILKQDPLVEKVYFLALTRKRT